MAGGESPGPPSKVHGPHTRDQWEANCLQGSSVKIPRHQDKILQKGLLPSKMPLPCSLGDHILRVLGGALLMAARFTLAYYMVNPPLINHHPFQSNSVCDCDLHFSVRDGVLVLKQAVVLSDPGVPQCFSLPCGFTAVCQSFHKLDAYIIY